MASLEDLSKSIGVDLKPSNHKAGKRRRSWLLEEDIDKKETGDNQSTKGLQTGDNQSTKGLQTGDNQSTKGLQTGDNQSTESTIYDYHSLTGIQKKIIEYMYKSCLDPKYRITEKINILDIQTALEIGESSAKTSILRLKEKKCIFINSRKNGRGGWCKYEIERNLFQSILKGLQTDINSSNGLPIYNNSNSNTTNTIKNKVREIDTTKNHSIEQKDQLIAEMQKQIAELQKRHHQDDSTSSAIEKTEVDNDDLYEIDISPLEPFGFTQKHLKQVIAFNSKLDDRSKINADDLEESIQHYAWALENRFEEMTEKYGKSFANNKLKILMGVLKKGQSWTEPQFRSAEEIALEEQVKVNKEKLKKLQALQEEAFNSAYELWKLELTKEQYTKIKDSLPSSYANLSDGSKMLVTALKNHFRENVYKG